MKLFLRTLAGTELVLRCVEFDTYRVAIGSNCVEFDTRFNVDKYITLKLSFSVDSKPIFTEASGRYSNAVEMSTRSPMLQSKLKKKLVSLQILNEISWEL